MSEPTMYIKYRDDKPMAYRYGDDLEATRLYLEGGYPTEEEAIKAWGREDDDA